MRRAPERKEEYEAQLKLVEVGWGSDDPSYRQLFASQFMPAGNLDALREMSELQRRSSRKKSGKLVKAHPTLAEDEMHLGRARHSDAIPRFAVG